MNTPETINIEKYANALNALVGIDIGYLGDSDENVNAIVEVIRTAKTLENRVKELEAENKKWQERLDREARCQYDLCEQIVNLRDDVKYIKAETVQKMRDKILAKSEYGTINISLWQLDQIAKEVLRDNKSYCWIITENGCVITCPKCGHRLELCYPDGTEVTYLPHCPWCGKELSKGE